MEKKVLFKKEYNLEQENDFIFVKEFLVLDCGKDRELALNLINDTNENCHDAKFVVKQLNSKGEEIGSSLFECRKMKPNFNREFVPNKTLKISDKCVDVVVELVFAVFDSAYYYKGELIPITPNMKKKLNDNLDERSVKSNSFIKTSLISIFFLIMVASIITFILISINEYTDTTNYFFYEGLEYRFEYGSKSSGNVIVTGLHDKNASQITIPEKIGDYKVIEIDNAAFSYCSNLNKVTIEGDVVINNEAFYYCDFLYSISMENVKFIGSNAFAECHSLINVELNNLSYLGRYAFNNCYYLESVEIENDEKSVLLNSYAFANCNNLQTLMINQKIDDNSEYSNFLAGCRNLKHITFDEFSDQTIRYLFGTNILLNQLSLELIKINEIDTISSNQFANLVTLKKIEIGNIKSGTINSSAFQGCTNLEDVVINSQVTYVGQYAFKGTKIKSFDFSRVSFLGTAAFEGTNITKANLIDSKITKIPTNAFKNCRFLEEVSLSNSITEIESSAFDSCTKLIKIDLPRKLEKLGSSAFYKCQSLVNIQIPGSILIIPSSCFEGCTTLETVNIAEGVKNLNTRCFNGCTNLKYVDLPDSIEIVGNNVFGYCVNIEYFKAPFIGANKNAVDSLTYFFATTPTALKEIVLTKISSLQSGTFKDLYSLEKVTIEGTLEVIPTYSFINCVNLENVSFPDSVSAIDAYAFCNCINLRKFTVNENITYIGDSAFKDCYRLWEVLNLSSLNIQKGSDNSEFGYLGQYSIAIVSSINEQGIEYEEIDYLLFGKYDNIVYLLDYTGDEEKVNLPSNVYLFNTNVNEYTLYTMAFYQKEITEISIASSVNSIGYKAFSECRNLESVVIKGTNLKSIGNDAFANCEFLEEFKIEYSCNLSSIGDYAFSNTRLFEIIVPQTVTSIGTGAFDYCENLTLVYNYSNLPISAGNSNYGGIAKNAFYVASSTSDLTVYKANGFTFAYKTNRWYLIDVSYEIFDEDLITLPLSFKYYGSNVTDYYLWDNLFNYNNSYGAYDLLVGDNVNGFERKIDISINTLYYYGSRSNYNQKNIYSKVSPWYTKYYSNCVHDYDTWTYDKYNNISTQFTELNWKNTKKATCKEPGTNTGTCEICDVYYEEEYISPLGHNYDGTGECTRCDASMVVVTDKVFETAIFENDETNPFIYENETIKSQLTTRYSDSELTINVPQYCTIELNVTFNLDTVDSLTVKRNGSTVYPIYSGYNSRTYTITANAGDVITIKFYKGSLSSFDSYVNITNIIFYYEE